MQPARAAADFYRMAAILLVVVILGLVVAGRAQARAAHDGSKLRFPVWELIVTGLFLLWLGVHFVFGTPVPTPAKVVALLLAFGIVVFPLVRALRYRDIEDF
jgi:apolipoprotein N-acyltransferase